MRALKRHLRRLYGEARIAPRRRDIQAELSMHFGRPLRLTPSGARGHDSIYRVENGAGILGVLRLLNPWRRRTKAETNMPYVLLDGPARLAREAAAYGQGAAAGLTPRILWQSRDALLCEYLPLSPLQNFLHAAPDRAWDFITAATAGLARLHRAGIVHMDTSLANSLANDDLSQIAFVDFEYAPAPGLSLAQARLYDLLRLVESCWKFMPPAKKMPPGEWQAAFDAAMDDEMRAADLDALRPALARVLAAPELSVFLRSRLRAL